MRFKLNHSSTRGNTNDKEYSLWVGDLTPDVDDFALYKTFGTRYNSIKTAKGIYFLWFIDIVSSILILKN